MKPIFNNSICIDKIVDVFSSSGRTNYMFEKDHVHLVIRPLVVIECEVRCFWHKRKLRAVCGPEYYVNEGEQDRIKNIVSKFFGTYGKNMIYNSATIDLSVLEDSAIIIELNSFGSDMLAGGEYFNWTNDFNILHNSDEPVYRFKKEFEW